MSIPTIPPRLYWLEKAAADGHPIGQNNLATMLLVGLGAKPDLARAITLYSAAVDAGYKPAMFGLAVAYERRGSSGADLVAALEWYEKAAATGNVAAIASVGRAYELGLGVPADPVAAFRWYREAAESGNAMAQTQLGIFYASGRGGIAENKPLAREWLGKAAAQFNPDAMLLLGRQLLVEPTEPDDTTEAVGWLQRAAAYGELEAHALLGEYFARAGDTEQARQHAAIVLREGTDAEKTYATAVLDLATQLEADALDPSNFNLLDPRAPARSGNTEPLDRRPLWVQSGRRGTGSGDGRADRHTDRLGDDRVCGQLGPRPARLCHRRRRTALLHRHPPWLRRHRPRCHRARAHRPDQCGRR